MLAELFVLRLVLGLFVFGTLAFGLMLSVCKGYYDEWMLLKSNAKFESKRNDVKRTRSKRDKDSKKKKVKPSSSCGSGSDKRSSQASQDSQASSYDGGQA